VENVHIVLATVLGRRFSPMPSGGDTSAGEVPGTNVLEFRLLGRFEASLASKAVPALQRPSKAQELLGYLLVLGDRPQRRDRIAEALWPESRGSASRKCLRQALWQLQTILERDCGGCPLLDVDQEWLVLAPCRTARIDVRELEAAYEEAREVGSDALTDGQVARLRAAVACYRGDLLESSYQDWCIFERERLKSTYLLLLDKLLLHAEARRRWEDALLYGGLILRYDRAHERTHQRMMRLHYLAGDRTAALRQYEACEGALERELGVRPGQQTAELYEQIKADRSIEDDLPTAIRGQQLRPARVLSHLRQVKRTLAYTENLVAEDIAEIEAALDAPADRA
jgi:DNA-binding SARP family transcriptional activator